MAQGSRSEPNGGELRARPQAERDQADGYETIKAQQKAAVSRDLRIRRPHCQNPVEIAADTPFSDIVCSPCRKRGLELDWQWATALS